MIKSKVGVHLKQSKSFYTWRWLWNIKVLKNTISVFWINSIIVTQRMPPWPIKVSTVIQITIQFDDLQFYGHTIVSWSNQFLAYTTFTHTLWLSIFPKDIIIIITIYNHHMGRESWRFWVESVISTIFRYFTWKESVYVFTKETFYHHLANFIRWELPNYKNETRNKASEVSTSIWLTWKEAEYTSLLISGVIRTWYHKVQASNFKLIWHIMRILIYFSKLL